MCTVQHLRAAVLRFMIHLVVVNGSLLMHCLQALVYSFQPPRIGASMAEDPNVLAEPWQPSELAVAVQDQVISALEQVRSKDSESLWVGVSLSMTCCLFTDPCYFIACACHLVLIWDFCCI